MTFPSGKICRLRVEPSTRANLLKQKAALEESPLRLAVGRNEGEFDIPHSSAVFHKVKLLKEKTNNAQMKIIGVPD